MTWPLASHRRVGPVLMSAGGPELTGWERHAEEGAAAAEAAAPAALTTGATRAGGPAPGALEPVHQVVYRWADPTLTGIRGVGPVATSLSQVALERWDGQLRESVWASAADPSAAGSRPGPGQAGTPGTGPTAVRAVGYAYLLVPAGAAVIRKVPTVDGDGRPGSTFAHVLVGSPEQLTVGMALGLYAWPGWLSAPAQPLDGGRLTPLALPDLIGAAESGLAHLDEPHRQLTAPVTELVTAVVDAVLADPAAPVTIVGAVPSPLTTVHALTSILEPAGAPWTFGTRERTDLGAAAPRLILLPPGTDLLAADQDRCRVRADQRSPAHPEARFARALVREFLRSGRAGLVALHPPGPIAATADVASWEQRVSVAPGILPGDVADAARRLLAEAARREDWELFEAQDGAFARAGLGRLPDDALIDLVGTVGARLTGPGRAVAWGRGQLLAGDAILDVAVGGCLRGPYPDRRPLLAATAALPLPAELAHAELADLLPRLARPVPVNQRLDLLRIMSTLGSPMTSDDRLTLSMFADVPGSHLLDLAVQLAGRERDLATLLAEIVAVRRDPVLVEMRTDNAWPLRHYLGELVRALGVDLTETTRLFNVLFGAAYGRRLPARVVREILNDARDTAHDPLLWAVQRLAKGRALREVEKAVNTWHWESRGLPPPEKGRKRPPRPGAAPPPPAARRPPGSDPSTGSPS
jgi:hypothetical protein